MASEPRRRDRSFRGGSLVLLGTDVADPDDDLAPDRASGRAEAMLALSERRVGALVVADAASVGPRLSDAAELVREARESGWAIVVADPAIDSRKDTGLAALRVIEDLAASEWAWRSARTKAPLDAARRGGVHLGRPHSIPAAIRQRILDDAAAGLGSSAIARALNDEGVPTPRGGRRWYHSTIRSVIERG